jgi:hypothetical protein
MIGERSGNVGKNIGDTQERRSPYELAAVDLSREITGSRAFVVASARIRCRHAAGIRPRHCTPQQRSAEPPVGAAQSAVKTWPSRRCTFRERACRFPCGGCCGGVGTSTAASASALLGTRKDPRSRGHRALRLSLRGRWSGQNKRRRPIRRPPTDPEAEAGQPGSSLPPPSCLAHRCLASPSTGYT